MYAEFNLKWSTLSGDSTFESCTHEERIGYNYCPVCGKKNELKTLDNLIAEYMHKSKFPGLNYAIDCSGNSYDKVSWYDWKQNMLVMSNALPKILFELTRYGEDGDVWKAYFFNGKCQETKGRIVFDEFDIDRLE